jgi:transposase
MQVLYERCCGIDVHKKKLVVCFKAGKKQELCEYGTLTKDLREMADWLMESRCQKIAMESTGSYWKPVYNILELLGLEVMVVNAQHMKAVPGRKTDMKDAQWIAELLQHGLLKASYIPDRNQRELREITRYRKSMVEERAREINRLERTLEGANIKLSSIVSDLTGKSSRNLIQAAMQGEITEETIETLTIGKVKEKKAALLPAMEGVISPMQKKLITAILEHIDDMTKRIHDLNNMLDGEMKQYEEAIRALDEIPGIGRQSAEVILAEIGLDMSRFPTAAHLASWAGICPGNHESAGKRKSGRTNKGNPILKTTLVQSAKTAVKRKDSFLRAQYERIKIRRGVNRASMAVAHSILIAIYHMLKYHQPFKDLGRDHYHQFNTEKKINTYLKKLAELGWQPPVPSAG